MEVTVNRPLVGVIACVCALIGAGLWLLAGESAGLWSGTFVRVGTVMAALWFALPRSGTILNPTLSVWQLGAVIGTLVLIVRSRLPLRLLIPGAILLAVTLLILRPRNSSRTRS